MIKAIYNTIGKTYDSTRCADPLIVERLIANLNLKYGGKYLDIACGSGNYTCALHKSGLLMEGIDVSEEMLNKARKKNPEISWHNGDAKALPFKNNSFDGATCILAAHHIKDIDAFFKEAYRIIGRGCFIIFTATPEQMKNYWLREYFPKMIESGIKDMEGFSKLHAALSIAGFRNIRQEKFFVTKHLQDLFLYSGKYRPEIYLEPSVRAGISSFQLSVCGNELERGLIKLEQDIQSGKIKEIIRRYESDSGDYSFVIGEKYEQ
jgi:ubiquinone/menaquinone biosynthesis C-methylase UbiE